MGECEHGAVTVKRLVFSLEAPFLTRRPPRLVYSAPVFQLCPSEIILATNAFGLHVCTGFPASNSFEGEPCLAQAGLDVIPDGEG